MECFSNYVVGMPGYARLVLTYTGIGTDVHFLSLDGRVGGYGDRVDFAMVRCLCCKRREAN